MSPQEAPTWLNAVLLAQSSTGTLEKAPPSAKASAACGSDDKRFFRFPAPADESSLPLRTASVTYIDTGAAPKIAAKVFDLQKHLKVVAQLRN